MHEASWRKTIASKLQKTRCGHGAVGEEMHRLPTRFRPFAVFPCLCAQSGCTTFFSVWHTRPEVASLPDGALCVAQGRERKEFRRFC